MNRDSAAPVLAAIDAGDDAGVALARAATLAAALHAPLELFACAFDQAMEGSHFRITERVEAARAARVAARREWLENCAAPWRDKGLEVHTTAIYANPRDEAIARHATATGARLVVMRTHHHAW